MPDNTDRTSLGLDANVVATLAYLLGWISGAILLLTERQNRFVRFHALQSVIVFYTGLLVPFAIFFLANFFRTVPVELIEAASSEGAGPFTVFRRIVLPLSGAASFTLIIVQAIWVWNELLIALVFLQSESSRTLMAGLTQFQGRFVTNQPLVLAGALLSIAPVVLLYLSGQRFFVRGLTAGIGK